MSVNEPRPPLSEEELSKLIADAMERSKKLVAEALKLGREQTRLTAEDLRIIVR